MNDLFSLFDPVGIMGLPMNWVSCISLVFFFPPFYWGSPSKWALVFRLVVTSLSKEFSVAFSPLMIPGVTFMTSSLLIYIFLNNFLGLFPYIFTSSSHLVYALAMSLPLWLGHMVKAIYVNIESVLAHFVPLSTPAALTPFMVIIEVVSSLIRPFTLAVRLAANMIAGHLLLALLSGTMVDQSLIYLSLIFIPLLALSILELAVSIIQSYVFSLLMTLYLQEVSSLKII